MNNLHFLFLVTLSGCLAQTVKYDNYKVFRIIPKTDEQLNLFRNMMKNNKEYDFWKEPSYKDIPVFVMVPPYKLADFYEILKKYNLQAIQTIDNVQKLIDETTPKYRFDGNFDWKDYYPKNTIDTWLENLEKLYPNIVKVVVGGRSYEGRNITGVKVSFKTGNKAVLIVGGIHAREWIAPATVTFILNEILTNQDSKIREIVENYDWYVFPSINPDGYEYSHKYNRLWRKNRKPLQECVGVDIERNWDFHWGDETGASNNPCDETYAGPFPFSEIESTSISEYFTSIHQNVTVFLSFHSFSQLMLIPYGYTNEHVDNYNELFDIGSKAAENLKKRHGTEYEVGNVVDILYPAAGITMDWVKGKLNIPIVYTVELRPDRYSTSGFLLPKEQIIPTGEETFDAVVTIIEEAKSRGH